MLHRFCQGLHACCYSRRGASALLELLVYILEVVVAARRSLCVAMKTTRPGRSRSRSSS